MSKKINCWEYMQCGREPGGPLTGTLGVCPASNQNTFDGFNRGTNAGRACWLVAGTFCDSHIQGSFAEKRTSCKECSFYKKIHAEEGRTYLEKGPLRIFAHTHIGRVNPYNEDRYFIKGMGERGTFIAIADGLGGNVDGDYAAEILRARLAAVTNIPVDDIQKELVRIVVDIDKTISREIEKDPSLEGMGSTLTGLFYRDGEAHWVHVGDSRLYLFRKKVLTQITKDQTLARFLLEEGEISAEEIPKHYSRHVMDQYLGCGYAEPEAGRMDLSHGDMLVLATDGLHKLIDAETIKSALLKDRDLEKKAAELIDAALEAGGSDNITVLLAKPRFNP